MLIDVLDPIFQPSTSWSYSDVLIIFSCHGMCWFIALFCPFNTISCSFWTRIYWFRDCIHNHDSNTQLTNAYIPYAFVLKNVSDRFLKVFLSNVKWCPQFHQYGGLIPIVWEICFQYLKCRINNILWLIWFIQPITLIFIIDFIIDMMLSSGAHYCFRWIINILWIIWFTHLYYSCYYRHDVSAKCSLVIFRCSLLF